MTRWLSSLIVSLRRDPPDRPLVEQYRALWQLPPGWTLPQTARVLGKKRKPLQVVKTERKAS